VSIFSFLFIFAPEYNIHHLFMTSEIAYRNEAKNAIAVHQFLASIPEDLQRHIFKQIIEDSFAQVELLPHRDACSQFLTALKCHMLEPINELCGKLCDLLFDESQRQEVIDAFRCDGLDKMAAIELSQLPEIGRIIRTFDFFSFRGGTDVAAANNLEGGIFFLLCNSENLGDEVYVNNAFEGLGWLSLMENIFSKSDQSRLFFTLFKRWYVDGQILDVVFDTICNSKIVSIKRKLWNHLVSKCLDDARLCEIVNRRWEEFVAFNNVLSFATSYKFETNGRIDDNDDIEWVEPLFEMKNSDADYFKMYSYLVNDINILKGDECSEEQFKDLFSARDKRIKRVTFHVKNEKHCGALMALFYEMFKQNKSEFNSISTAQEFIEQKFRKSIKCLMLKKGEVIESNYNARNMNEGYGMLSKNKFKECHFLNR